MNKQKDEKISKIKEINLMNNKICENKIKIKDINSKPIDDIFLLLKKNYKSKF